MKTILAFLLLISTAFGGHSVCLRVRECDGQQCTNGFGTAVVLSRSDAGVWSASTAAHVVGRSTALKIDVFLDGQWVPIRSVYRLETDDDAAFVTFDYAGKLDTTKTIQDDTDVTQGEAITFSGFSGGSTFERSAGVITSHGTARVENPPKQGQSGGGVYRKRDGVLIGVLTGYQTSDPHTMIYTPCGRCRRQCQRQWGFWWGVCVQPLPRAHVAQQPAPKPVESAPPPPVERPSIPGPPGPQGPPGRDGNDADVAAMQVTIDALKLELKTLRETKIPVQILNPDGTIHDQATYTLGKPIKLKLAPITPDK